VRFPSSVGQMCVTLGYTLVVTDPVADPTACSLEALCRLLHFVVGRFHFAGYLFQDGIAALTDHIEFITCVADILIDSIQEIVMI